MVKENYWPNFTTNAMVFSFRILDFPIISCNILSAPAYGVSCHNSYIIPELAVITQIFFYIAIDVLQLGLCNRVLLLQNWNHNYWSFIVVIMISWIVTVYFSASWMKICSACHSFPLLFCLPCTWLFMSNSVDPFEKQETLTLPVHLIHAPRFLWSSICSFTFVTFMYEFVL